MDVDQTKAAESLPQKLLVNGISVPQFFSRSWVEEGMKNMALCPDDIWVVCYPKSGSTWTQQIVKLILNNGKETDKMILSLFLGSSALTRRLKFLLPLILT